MSALANLVSNCRLLDVIIVFEPNNDSVPETFGKPLEALRKTKES